MPASKARSNRASPNEASPSQIFDRALVRQRRNRAARGFDDFDFLLRRCEADFLDRLQGVNRERFHGRPLTVLILGCHTGFSASLSEVFPGSDLKIIFADQSEAMVRRAGLISMSLASMSQASLFQASIVSDEEWLPFDEASFDLILAPLTLHFANDLPGALIQIRRSLKPGGLFLSAVFGGETLSELRVALTEAEIEVEGGLSPRVIPFTDVKDYGALLQRAGFHEPVSDLDRVEVSYGDFERLVRDLRGMGLTNPMVQRRKEPMSGMTLARAKDVYESQFGSEDGLSASFHILYGTAWAQEPKTRGSA